MADQSYDARWRSAGRTSRFFAFRHIKLGLAAWLVLEVILFSLVVRELGVGGAILLGLLTSVIGVSALRRLGRDAIATLRRTIGQQAAPEGALLDGTLAALGALLLILPGFASDLVGLALITPSLRRTLMSRLGVSDPGDRPLRRRPAAGVIDLAPDEWSVSEPARR